MQIADNARPLTPEAVDTLLRYREQLLAAGFREPIKWQSSSWHWLFFKPLTELTAFVVNLQGHDDRTEVVFGCASTAFTRMAGDADALVSLGVGDDEITLRSGLSIAAPQEEAAAARRIRQMYDDFAVVEKDALLAQAKEKRQAFIRQIVVLLKPLGFRKKANTWTKPLPDGFVLTFSLQKSSYSDLYYFNVFLRAGSMTGYGCCYDARIAPAGEGSGSWRMDWQLISPEELTAFLQGRLLPVLTWLIDTPLRELGADPSLWQHCDCQRTHCEHCWVQRNLWEARQTDS